jgi:peptide/nickel transport system permease protein
MTGFLIGRTVRAFIVITILVVVTFVLSRSIGDPARLAVGIDASQAQYEQMRVFLGQNQSTLHGLVNYLGRIVHGDFGTSTWQRTPASRLVMDRLPATLTLAATASLMGLLVGVPMGLLAGAARRGPTRSILSAVPMILVSLAEFWVGIMLILVFSVKLGWLPTSGSGGWKHLILPGATLSMVPVGMTAALVAASVREEMSKKYVSAARAKGLTEGQIMRMHVLKNVAPTFLTVLAYQFVYIFTGAAVLVETVFQWPGIGKLAVDSVLHSDVVLISAIVVVTGIVVAVVNTTADIAHYAIDRRVKMVA